MLEFLAQRANLNEEQHVQLHRYKIVHGSQVEIKSPPPRLAPCTRMLTACRRHTVFSNVENPPKIKSKN